MLDYADNGAFIDRQKPEIRQAIEHTLKHIRTNGAARSVDFKNKKRKAGAWWDWSAEKQALEHLFNAGGLMISQRSGFQRVYDLTDRVLPVWDDRDTCSLEEGLRAIVVKAVKALGLAPARRKSR